MQTRGDSLKAYQFALIQYVPDAAANERVNVGLLFIELGTGRMQGRVSSRTRRLRRVFKDFDTKVYRALVGSLARRVSDMIALGSKAVPLDEALDKLGLNGSGCFQASQIMGGAVADPDKRLVELYREFLWSDA